MKECKCDKPLLQPLTKQCGKCKMYIDRVRHIILTNKTKRRWVKILLRNAIGFIQLLEVRIVN